MRLIHALCRQAHLAKASFFGSVSRAVRPSGQFGRLADWTPIDLKETTPENSCCSNAHTGLRSGR